MPNLGLYLARPEGLFYKFAMTLFYPVLAVELAALIWVLYEAGRFTYELVARRGRRRLSYMETEIGLAKQRTAEGDPAQAMTHLKNAARHSPLTRRYIDRLAASPQITKVKVEKLLEDTELEASRRLEAARILTRLGPMLGLMTTLIPISPALIGLARGDVQTLSNNLVIAFSTTVIGLLIGGVAFIIATVRDRLYTQDISDIEYILDLFEEA
jgi:biopolymer transport protein ExbB/TolQ